MASLWDMLTNHASEVYNTLSNGKVGQDLRADANKIKTGSRARMEQLASMSPQDVAMSFGFGGTLNLPKNLQKALQQGFRVNEHLYHGTTALDDFDSFLPNIARNDGSRTGGKDSISLSTSTDTANRYAPTTLSDEYLRKQAQYIAPAGPRVLPVVTRGNLFEGSNFDHAKLALDYLESKKIIKNMQDYSFYKKALKSKDWGVVEHDLGKDFFKQHGFTGARVMEGDSDNVIMFDPTAIRSRFAKFNKKDAKSANLLASGLLGSLLLKEEDND